jgi:hypothetical protein
MLEFKPNLVRQPTGGWHFYEGINCLRAPSSAALIKKMREYRIRNGLPVGDPKRELIDFCALNWPNLVQISDDPPTRPMAPIPLSEIQQWLVRTARELNPGTIEEEWIEFQAAICRACPCNQPMPKLPADLSKDVERRSFLLRVGRKIEGLGYCCHHHWDNRVAVARNRKGLHPVESMPDQCWMKSKGNGGSLNSV